MVLMVRVIMRQILFMGGFNMKKGFLTFINIVFFFNLIIFVFTYLSYLMKPKTVTLENINGFYGEKKNSLDMIYIGGSASFIYYQPLLAYQEYGFTSYDYAAYVIQPELYTTLIKEALKTQKPDLFVIDARSFQYREGRLPEEVHYRNFLTGMDFSLNKLDFIHNNVDKNLKMEELSFIFDIIKYHRSLSSEDINDRALEMMFHQYKNENKGFFFVPAIQSLEKYDTNTKEEVKIAKETEDILIDLLDYIDKLDTKVLFVVSPYQEKLEHKKQFNYIEKIITERGYDFLDANDYVDKMELDYENDLYNFNHVNVFGAEKYTRFLSEYIDKTYHLKDHRKDKDYQEWGQLVEPFQKKVEETKKTINAIKGNGEV